MSTRLPFLVTGVTHRMLEDDPTHRLQVWSVYVRPSGREGAPGVLYWQSVEQPFKPQQVVELCPDLLSAPEP